MTPHPATRSLTSALLILVLGLLFSSGACAQDPVFRLPEYKPEPRPTGDTDFLKGIGGLVPEAGLGSRSPRFRLFRMPTGFLSDPVGLDLDPDPSPADGILNGSLRDGDDGAFGRMQVNVGQDNPFFDFRRPGDPGGVGYYSFHSQLQLLETRSTGFTLGCQAFTPAGYEANGVPDGPTFLSPNLALYHALGDSGTAIQGFVGKNVRANSRWLDTMDRGIKCGMAIQQPLITSDSDPSHGLFLFVEALGHVRRYNDSSANQPSPLEFLPGMHWRVNENWWLSGGVIMPVGAQRFDPSLWQITCSLQF
jgi:hypothetical protein